MRVRPNPEEIIEVYIDESSQTKHRYLILGALVVNLPDSALLEQLLSKARLPELPAGEAKWTKASKSKVAAYKRMVDVFFKHSEALNFHSLFVDTTKQDHKRFNEGSREIGFNKEIYQLATKVAKLYPRRLFHLYPDYRDSAQGPDDLRLILNRGRRKQNDPRDWPFRRAQFRDSKQVQALQLVDVFIGAIGFHINGHIKAADASPAKIELSNYILQKAGVADPMKGTAKEGAFTIWPRQLK